MVALLVLDLVVLTGSVLTTIFGTLGATVVVALVVFVFALLATVARLALVVLILAEVVAFDDFCLVVVGVLLAAVIC